MITELKPNQVFVYGCNSSMFQGAGAAGFAFSGTVKNDWRTCPLKQSAIKNPFGINKSGRENRVGRWNVWGFNDCLFQKGYLGSSYGIITVERPGGPKIPLLNIRWQFEVLFNVAKKNPDKEFLMTAVGTGYGGYTHEEINKEWRAAIDSFGHLPSNIVEVGSYV